MDTMDTGNSLQADMTARIEKMIKDNQAKIPQNYAWDWHRLFRSIVEKKIRVVGYITPVLPSGWQPPKRKDHRVGHIPEWKPDPIPKAPGSGDWKYVWYVPEWSHPDFDPHYTRTYTGEVKYIGHSNPINLMCPALRPVDLIKRPTPWATRFGIHPDEIGGRSRLSPTLAPTRDPLEDFESQVNLLSEDERKEAVRLTREKAEENRISIPDDPNYIDPQIMEHLLSRHGLMSSDEFKQNLQSILGKKAEAHNLEVFEEELKSRDNLIYKAHQTFLHNALKDQEYQRLIFRDWTSDELVANKVFDMSDDVYCDLPEDIHPLFQKHHWIDTSQKGSLPERPRYLYNLGGVREEWDVHTNDRLWKALQPALRLVTQVLNSNHPVFQAMMDMRTRQPLNPSLDQRKGKKQTPHLTRIVPIDEIDMRFTYPGIRNLDNWGYSWPDNVLRVLSGLLMVDIGSAWVQPFPDDKGGVNDSNDMVYAWTWIRGQGPKAPIVINIAGELIWPLLVSGYSESEKMTTSFALASTILHEYAHAIFTAQRLLTTNLSHSLLHDRSSAVGAQLLKVAAELWDMDTCQGEHYWESLAITEAGFTAERQLWGAPTLNMMGNSVAIRARQVTSLPLILELSPFPSASWPRPPGIEYPGPLRNPLHPIENYYTLIPIEYMAKFFTQKFWNEDYQRFGPEALKSLPLDHARKMALHPTYVNHAIAINAFGADEWVFLNFVTEFLSLNGHGILGAYLERAVQYALGPSLFVDRWTHEVKNWIKTVLQPLNGSINDLESLLDTVYILDNRRWDDTESKNEAYWNYHQEHRVNVGRGTAAPGTLLSQDQWLQKLHEEWTIAFRIGGTLMRQVSETYRDMAQDVTHMERMLFDFFNLNPDQRLTIYRGFNNQTSPMVAAQKRMHKTSQWAVRFAKTCEELSIYRPLQAIGDHWAKWGACFRSCAKTYTGLLDMLRNAAQLHPDDNEWKKRFVSIPSSAWKSSYDRIHLLAEKEYQRVDPPVREVIEECMKIIGTQITKLQLPEEQLGIVTQAIGNINAIGQDLNTIPNKDVFAWEIPGPQLPEPPIIADRVWQSSSARFQNTTATPSNTGGVVFGHVSQLNSVNSLGADPPLRHSNSSSGPGVRHSGTSNVNQNPAFSQWNQPGTAEGFAQVASQGMGALDTVREIGVAPGTINQIGGLDAVGPQQAIFNAPPPGVNSFATTGFNQGQAWFPVAFANAATSTVDHYAYQQQTAAAAASMNAQSGPAGRYKTARLWRENPDDDNDDDDGNRARTPDDPDDPSTYAFVPPQPVDNRSSVAYSDYVQSSRAYLGPARSNLPG
ncbi:hypothetical protein K449DRAFT_443855 [Hypoxylon sp. EC38]|nr:hypothetical protein K449DRAFT_443855 [Hypoxylon sp. EC38]